MAAGKVLRYTLAHRNPETLEVEALLAGTEKSDLPDWAKELVHDDDFAAPDSETDGGSSDEPYAKWKKSDLEVEVSKRNEARDDDDKVVVGGTGTVKDLAAALDADDAAGA